MQENEEVQHVLLTRQSKYCSVTGSQDSEIKDSIRKIEDSQDLYSLIGWFLNPLTGRNRCKEPLILNLLERDKQEKELTFAQRGYKIHRSVKNVNLPTKLIWPVQREDW